MAWNPVEKPYRVLWTGRVGPRYWEYRTEPKTFATEEEARAAFDAPMVSPFTTVELDFAENAATWLQNGRWRHIAKRKRQPKPARR